MREHAQGHSSPPPLPKEKPLDVSHDVVSGIAHSLYWIAVLYLGITGYFDSGFVTLAGVLVLGAIFYEPFARLFPFVGPRL